MTLRRFVEMIPEVVRTLARDGEEAYRNTQEIISHRDFEAVWPMDYVVMDHRRLDVFCLMRERGGWKLARPWLTAAIDMRTRKWLAWCIVETPSSDSIAAVLKRVFLNYGLPKELYWDNGKDFRCEWFEGKRRQERTAGRITDLDPTWRGVLGTLNIRVRHAIVRNARAKLIEPNFGRVPMMTVSVDKVRDLIDALAQQRTVRSKILAEVEAAEADAKSAAAEVGQISRTIADREAALARSGETLPVSLFEEDQQLLLAQRHSRILSLRAATERDRLRPIDERIGQLKCGIPAAWRQVGEAAYRGAAASIDVAAKEMQTLLTELTVLAWIFRDSTLVNQFVSVPTVIIEWPNRRERTIDTNGASWLRSDVLEKTDLYGVLRRNVEEITEALTGRPPTAMLRRQAGLRETEVAAEQGGK